MAYKLKYDLHTHTTYSHGKGSILDNVSEANAKGLKMIGIADHGYGHIFYGIKKEDIPNMRHDIELAKDKFPDVDVQLSVEANIINASGMLDISKEEQKDFDYIIAGYHYGVLGEKPMKAIGVCIGGYCKLFSNKTFNTDVVVKALYENDIKVLTHPGDKILVDMDAVAKACEDTKTIMEINNHHNGLSVANLEIAAKYDVDFVISSDAHLPQNVGTFEVALNRANTVGLPFERIINLWNY